MLVHLCGLYYYYCLYREEKKQYLYLYDLSNMINNSAEAKWSNSYFLLYHENSGKMIFQTQQYIFFE